MAPEWRRLIGGLVMFWCVAWVNAAEPGEAAAASPVKVTMAPAAEVFAIGGPIAISVSVVNVSGREIVTDANPVRWPNIEASMITARGRVQGSLKRHGGKRSLTPIRPGATLKGLILLNDVLPVRFPGEYELTLVYAFRVFESNSGLPVAGAKQEEVRHSETVTILVKTASDSVIAASLEREAARAFSGDRESREVGLAALCNTDSPVVVPYLVKVLRMPDVQPPAVRALSKFNAAEATMALHEVVNSDDPDVVIAAFEALDLRDHSVSTDELVKLLGSPRAGIRWAVLDYAISQKRVLPAATVTKLQKDPNPGVAELAQQYAETHK